MTTFPLSLSAYASLLGVIDALLGRLEQSTRIQRDSKPMALLRDADEYAGAFAQQTFPSDSRAM